MAVGPVDVADKIVGMRNQAIAMVVLACAACSEADGAPRATAAAKVEVKNECLLGAGRDDRAILLFHVLFDVHYAATKASPAHTSRQVYQFKCGLDNGKCTGISLNLNGIDHGSPLGMMDLDEITDAVVSTTGSTFTLKWPTLRTFSLDLSGRQGLVRYVESGEGLIAGHVEGRAESTCELTDVRMCSSDAGCVPTRECRQGKCFPRG